MYSGMKVQEFSGSRSGRRDLGSKFPQGPAAFFMKRPMTVAFRADPPITPWQPLLKDLTRKKPSARSQITGVAAMLSKFEATTPPARVMGETPKVRCFATRAPTCTPRKQR